jgi:FAD:protein FMN transferase
MTTLTATKHATRTHRMDFRAMGCQFTALVNTAGPWAASTALNAAWAFVNAAEAVMTRFLSRLNASAGAPVRVSALLWEAVACSLEAARTTGGIYDPTVLGALLNAGYDQTFIELRERRRAQPQLSTLRPSGAWREVRMDSANYTIGVPAGSGLDLGGTGKAWTADRAAAILAQTGPCLLDAGGDICALGRPEGEGWVIGVENPFDPTHDLVVLEVTGCGVATSGIDYRRWKVNGSERHHIIDPRTGEPAKTDLLTATVVAPTAAEADKHALVTVVLGSGPGMEYLGGQPGVEGIVVLQDGTVRATPGMDNYVV